MRMRSSCSGVALSPARIAAGSPGVSRNSRNTNSATTPITGIAASTRRRRYPSISSISCVVPAKAGTQTRRPDLLETLFDSFGTTIDGCGYGSLLSQGRRIKSAEGGGTPSYGHYSLILPTRMLQRLCRGGKPLMAFPTVLADRHRADPRQVHIGQAGLIRPGIELRLHLGQVALGFHFRCDVEPSVAQAGNDILRGDKAVPADEAQKHLAGIAAEAAAAFGDQIEQADLVGGGPLRQEFSEAAIFPSDLLHEGGILANRRDLGAVAHNARIGQ